MLIEKSTIIVDTSKGPHMYHRYHLNLKPLLKFLITMILIVAFILTTYLVAVAAEPKIEVHCTNANYLVFRGIETGEYIAYVRLANAEQVEAIKKLNVKADPSVDDFRLCKTEVHHYEIRLDGEKVFVHADDVIPPSNYNYTLTDQELVDMLAASSDEVKYLYAKLNRIFKKQ